MKVYCGWGLVLHVFFEHIAQVGQDFLLCGGDADQRGGIGAVAVESAGIAANQITDKLVLCGGSPGLLKIGVNAAGDELIF